MLFSNYLLMIVIMKQSSLDCLHNTNNCGSLSREIINTIREKWMVFISED